MANIYYNILFLDLHKFHINFKSSLIVLSSECDIV